MRRTWLVGLIGAALCARAAAGAAEGDQKAVAEAANKLAFGLYAKLRAGERGNLFFSPASIWTALAMTSAGGRGETEKEFVAVLRVSLPQARLHPAAESWLGHLATPPAGQELKIANALFAQRGQAFLPEFLDSLKRHYRATAREVDFQNATEEARQAINLWVEEQTARKIRDLFPPGILNDLTRLVLVNAVYFKGRWRKVFDKEETREEPFHLAEGRSVQAPLMSQEAVFPYAQAAEGQVLEMPYGGEGLSLVIFLPRRTESLGEVEAGLTAEQAEAWMGALRPQRLRIFLPRFKVSGEFRLDRLLQDLGLRTAFTPAADFSGLNGRRDLYLQAVVHKAFGEVNEEGTEAAAATGVAVGVTSAPMEEPPFFRADRPFLFWVRDRVSGTILFLGRVVDPR